MTDYNADDRAAVTARKTKLDRQREQAQADWRWLLSDERGRRIVRALLDTTGALDAGRTLQPGQPDATAYHTGRADVGRAIFGAATSAAPDLLPLLLGAQDH